jgi:hypothetical protein
LIQVKEVCRRFRSDGDAFHHASLPKAPSAQPQAKKIEIRST